MVTAEYLRQILHYEPETGLFYWKVSRRRNVRRTGDVAGKPRRKGYCQIWIDNKPYSAHRLAFLYMNGRWPTGQIDHKDRDPANNRWDNLRECERQMFNNANMRRPSRNTSGVKGVSWSANAGKWYAYIQSNGRSYNLGYHDTIEAAAEAYQAAAKQHFGEFVSTG